MTKKTTDWDSNVESTIINDQVTRTNETIEMYRYRVKGIIKQASKDGFVNDSINPNPKEIAYWLISKKSNYCAATYRQYRAAIQMWLGEITHPDGPAAIDLLNTVNTVPYLKRHLSARTSATKEKKFSDADRQAIINWLNDHHTRYSAVLCGFLRIGATIGLRPCEFKNARVVMNENSGYELRVGNAKATNGRANGDFRTLLLDDLPDEMIDIIVQFIMTIRKLDKFGEWKRLYNGCRKTLYRASRDLWPNRKKYPTLYSLRHQFSADAKSAGRTTVEVAALMGHASAETATAHYGKKRYGRKSCAVQPSHNDLSRLASQSELFQPGINWSKP